MNENNLDKKIENWKKVYKDKADQIQKRNDRKLRVRKKRLVVKKIDDDKYDRL